MKPVTSQSDKEGMANFVMGRTLLPVYIMIKKNTPVINNLGKTGLSCNKEAWFYTRGCD